MPIVKKLGNRVFQIYIFTILTGTLLGSLAIALVSWDAFMFFAALFFGAIITSVICLPNIIILYLGLKYVYKHSTSEEQKKHYFYYLWIILSAIPLLLFLTSILWGSPMDDIFGILLPVPYILSSLYYLFKINNKYDEQYPPNFAPLPDENILDADLDHL